MAFQLTPGGLWVPPWHVFGPTGVAISFSGHQMDASTEHVAFILKVPKTGTLDQFEFMTGSIATFPGNGLRCSFQDVDLTTGQHDGTVDQHRVIAASPGANTWVSPGLITSDGTDTGTKRTVTAGEYLACVIDFNPTYTTGSVFINTAGSGGHSYATPYSVANGVKQSSTNIPLLALKYNDGSYVPIQGVYPFATHSSDVYNNGSTPDECGLIFRFPVAVKVGGCWLRADMDGDSDIVLYDSDGTTPLSTVSTDLNVRGNTTATICFLPFASEVQLAANTDYRLVLKPTTATSGSLFWFAVNSTAHLAMVAGSAFHWTERTDAGAWSQTTTRMPWIGLMVTAIDDAGGGAGGGLRLAGHGGLAA